MSGGSLVTGEDARGLCRHVVRFLAKMVFLFLSKPTGPYVGKVGPQCRFI
jgi:hypothetical protein